jgi:hypothetical protein
MGTHGNVPLYRTHIMLTREQYELLKNEADVAGVSLGELVRRALDHVYRPWVRLKVRGWEVSFAIWKRPDAAVVARRIKSRTNVLSVRSSPGPSRPERL